MAQRTPPKIDGFTLVGQIVTTFGLKGHVKVEPTSNIDSRFKKGESVFLNGIEHEIVESRSEKGRFVIKVTGINSVEAAQKLQWAYLYVPSDRRPELDEDEYMIDELVGMKVVTVDGEALGEVDDVLNYPAHDILVVGEVLIPAVEAFVEMVDFDSETITVRLLEGMREPS